MSWDVAGLGLRGVAGCGEGGWKGKALSSIASGISRTRRHMACGWEGWIGLGWGGEGARGTGRAESAGGER